ncbi:hypothetical protein [Streptacidiphilus melanogenes]|uniref:hypothetical protein n=1 Tax=Streptacidiphilus melanogenes TaxID=411235 RepID=UPI0005A7F2EE|nr:hypothetical protein [Streptacidiphilus melanogenes]
MNRLVALGLATALTLGLAGCATTASPRSDNACDPGLDVLVWYRVPTLPDTAQRLGSDEYPDCAATFDMIQETSPTDPGYCTEAAWAWDNPGYNEHATPAKHLRDAVVRIGPAC